MKRLELTLDDDVAQRLDQFAHSRGLSPEALAADILRSASLPPDSMLGLMSDIPDVLDEMVRNAHDFRRSAPPRNFQ